VGKEYFPIYPEELEGLPIKYLALGHFHRRFYLGSDPVPYCYPGSAYPMSKKEIGRRYVALVELTPERTSAEPLHLKRSPYYELKELWCSVGKESLVLNELEEFLKMLQPPALPAVIVKGFSKDERGFRKELEGLLTNHSYPAELLTFDVKGIERLVQNRFYTEFASMIEAEMVKDPGSKEMLKLALEIFTEGLSKYLDQRRR
jgi:DNA repair exonuclease SbcCD nuclease subunit